jgi:hypothetical protein
LFFKWKKSTGHIVTRLAANQFIKHIQLKSIYQDESLTQACSPIKCATLASNKMIRCNLDMQAPTILPSCQEFVVLYWISIGTITEAATSKSKGHLSKMSMKPITIVYNLTIQIFHDEHETYNNSIQPYNSYLAPQFWREENKAERWMIPPQVSQLTTSSCHGIPNRNLLKLPGKWLFVYFLKHMK